MIEAIIFDHDGTLVDSESITLGVVAEIAADAGADIFPEDIDRFVGADLHIVFQEIERRSGSRLPEDIFDQFRERQTAGIRNGLKEIDGATDLLSALTRSALRAAARGGVKRPGAEDGAVPRGDRTRSILCPRTSFQRL